MSTISSYGKKNIYSIKEGFISDAKELIYRDTINFSMINEIGLTNNCNVCGKSLSGSAMTKHKINYYKCKNCGMVGAGKIKDYSRYNRNLYQDSDYGAYKGFEGRRLKEIYKPKVDYLIKVLPDVLERGVIDIGAGMGYFVKALRENNIKAKGYEVNKKFTEFFNKLEGDQEDGLIHVNHDKLIDALKKEDPNQVISLIHVLEHVEDPVNLLSEIKSIGFRHIFLAVPIFGFSTTFEFTNDNYYHRNLSPDHLYLYTNHTLRWLEEKIGFKRDSDWYFGQDMHDLARILSYQNTGFNLDGAVEILENLQLAIDNAKQSSEIHLLWSI